MQAAETFLISPCEEESRIFHFRDGCVQSRHGRMHAGFLHQESKDNDEEISERLVMQICTDRAAG
jgi:hypothetical protein